MFFDNPGTAFANLAKTASPGGRLCFVCWQEMFANEGIAVPAMAMVARVGIPELHEPGAPGPFALADAGRTRHLLAVLEDVKCSIGAPASREAGYRHRAARVQAAALQAGPWLLANYRR